MITLDELKAVARDTSFAPPFVGPFRFEFRNKWESDEIPEPHKQFTVRARWYVRVVFESQDTQGGVNEQHGRWWVLSPHMTKSEFVQTLFKAVMTAVEHEVREWFHYKGQPVLRPHFDVDALHILSSEGHTDERKEPEKVTV